MEKLTVPKISEVIESPVRLSKEALDKDLLCVIDRNPDYVWSESMEDLKELATWSMDPGVSFSSFPREISRHPLEKSTTLNSWFEVDIGWGKLGGPIPTEANVISHFKGGKRKTPTLRTVRNHLIKLHKEGKISRLLLHGNNYYASKKNEKTLVSKIKYGLGSKPFPWDSSEVVPLSEREFELTELPDDEVGKT